MSNDLNKAAVYFRAIAVPSPGAVPEYDLLSDAVVWTDELPEEVDPAQWWAIRPVLHHRTCLILSVESSLEETWQVALELFPEWIGFLPERRQSVGTLPDVVRKLQTRSHESARRFRAELERKTDT